MHVVNYRNAVLSQAIIKNGVFQECTGDGGVGEGAGGGWVLRAGGGGCVTGVCGAGDEVGTGDCDQVYE